MKKLRISPDLALPFEAVTETFAVLAKRGAGKTYTAKVLIEEMLENDLPVVVVDPIGAWWGLRAGADGKPGGGYEVAVLGGDRGDIPLEPGAGALVADLIVDERLSAVLDLSSFSKKERRDFVRYFLERLYQRNRDPLHVVLEEADLFAPEGNLKQTGDEFMLGAVYDLVRRGRARGLGCTMITQRSASISKEVLTQAEILIALRTTGPHDRKAIEDWIKFHGTKEERDVVLGEISGLPTGTAYVWWPVEEILKKVEIRQARTYDSSATPKPGERRRPPKKLADVDLAALQKQMAATIEKAEAEDPKKLQVRVRELEKQLKTARESITETTTVETVVERVEVPVLDAAAIERLETSIAGMRDVAKHVARPSDVLEEAAEAVAQAIMHARHSSLTNPVAGASETAAKRPRPAVSRTEKPSGRPVEGRDAGAASSRAARPALDVDAGFTPSGPQQRILDSLAALEAIGVDQAHKTQLALFAEASPKSSSYTNNLGALRTAGFVAYPGPSRVALTDAGRAIADASAAPSTSEELHAFVFGLVGPAKARILGELISLYDAPIEKAELAERIGASATSSSFTNNLGSLRSLGLIDYPAPGEVVALPVLFLEAA